MKELKELTELNNRIKFLGSELTYDEEIKNRFDKLPKKSQDEFIENQKQIIAKILEALK